MLAPLPAAHNENFRETMSCFATGVCVVSIDEPEKVGVTINSLVSVSLEPLLILFCLGKDTKTHEHFLKSAQQKGQWGISMLAQAQEDISTRFTHWNPDLWDQTPLLPQSGAPLLAGGAAYLKGEFDSTFNGGDHTIFLCRVTQCLAIPEMSPLIYTQRHYRALAPSAHSI